MAKNLYESELELHRARIARREWVYVQMRRARRFMAENLGEEIDLERIAAAAFVSRFHFVRRFREVYGLTPRQLLRDLRIGRARTLLLEGRSVTSVCFDVGYGSVTTFSNTFRRGTGVSPTEYRRRNLRNRE